MKPIESRTVAKPTEITSEQLRRGVGETLKRVAYAGESFVVTFHGKPVARIVPLTDDEKQEKPKPRSR